MTAPDQEPQAASGADRGPGEETLLVGLVEKALAAMDAGQTLSPTKLCAGHPELQPAVEEALGMQLRFTALHGAAKRTGVVDAGPPLAGRYTLKAPLGRGAMGAVFVARDEDLGRDVAVKRFEAAAGEEAQRTRFKREAEALASLQDPHVVGVYDRGVDPQGRPFLVMELVRGAPLSAVLETAATRDGGLRPGPWLQALVASDQPPPADGSDLRLAVRWAAEIADGLVAAHEAGVVHRDVKPSNVVVRGGGGRPYEAVLIDFGIAARAGDATLTATRTSLGTPWYMPPEQARGDERSHPTLDVYALSATLYHMVTGRTPYDGTDALEVLQRIQREDPVPAHRVRGDVPRDLQAILDRGLDRNPRRRYQTMAALRDDLRAFLELRAVSVRPLGRAGRWLRSLRYRPAQTAAAALAVALVPLVYATGSLWREASARERIARAEARGATVPALLAIEGQPTERLLVPLTERRESLALLDEILELTPEDHATRLFRAALRLDIGETAAARDDLETIAATTTDPYLRAVAGRYAAIPAGGRGAASLDLSGLPDPVTALGHFVEGFHALRMRDTATALEAFDLAIPTLPPGLSLAARDVRLIALLGEAAAAPDRPTRTARLEAFLDECARVEGAMGRRTARTLALRGAALVILGRYQDALEPLEESNALRPGRHGPLNNLGICYMRLGRLDEAEEALGEAAKLRPHLINTRYTQVQLLYKRGKLDEALAAARDFPAPNATWIFRRALLVSEIHRLMADRARAAGDARAVMVHVDAARRVIEAALPEVGGPESKARLRLQAQVTRITAGETPPLGEFLGLLAEDPTNPQEIRNLIDLLPDEGGLDAATVEALRDYFSSLLFVLSPDPASTTGGIRAREAEADATGR